MSRIRSIHPGFWTDEAVVSVSHAARLLLIGIWNQSDDKGAFEWKPVQLKMRVFPADNVDVVTLLTELEAADLVRQYTVDQRSYGAVRNFVRFQRPKKPNDVFPMPEPLRAYAKSGSTSAKKSGTGSEPVGNQFGTDAPSTTSSSSNLGTETTDGGGRRKEGRGRRFPPQEGGVGGDRSSGRKPRVNGAASATGPPQQFRNGFISTIHDDMERSDEHASSEDPHRDRPAMVPGAGRANRR